MCEHLKRLFNLALLLQRKGAYAEAADYWRQYLTSDHVSEWAERARRSLRLCEIQVDSLTCRARPKRIPTRPLVTVAAKLRVMEMLARYLEKAAALERMADEENDAKLKADLLALAIVSQ